MANKAFHNVVPLDSNLIAYSFTPCSLNSSYTGLFLPQKHWTYSNHKYFYTHWLCCCCCFCFSSRILNHFQYSNLNAKCHLFTKVSLVILVDKQTKQTKNSKSSNPPIKYKPPPNPNTFWNIVPIRQ